MKILMTNISFYGCNVKSVTFFKINNASAPYIIKNNLWYNVIISFNYKKACRIKIQPSLTGFLRRFANLNFYFSLFILTIVFQFFISQNKSNEIVEDGLLFRVVGGQI